MVFIRLCNLHFVIFRFYVIGHYQFGRSLLSTHVRVIKSNPWCCSHAIGRGIFVE